MKYISKYSIFNEGLSITDKLTDNERRSILGELLHNYGSIPIQKSKASEVINKILIDVRGSTFKIDDVVKRSSIIAPYNKLHDKLRFSDYFDSLLSSKEIRGHNFEGLVSGLFGGKLSTSKTSRYDVDIDGKLLSVKFVDDSSETPVLGSIKSVIQSKYKDILDKYDVKSSYELFVRSNGLLESKYDELLKEWQDNQIRKGKSNIIPGEGTRKHLLSISDKFISNLRKNVFMDSFNDVDGFIISYPKMEDGVYKSIIMHYITKDEMCNFVCNSNIVRPKNIGDVWSLRISSTYKGVKLKDDMIGSKFEVVVPYITDDELIELSNQPGLEWAKKVFGDYIGSRLRTDVISIIKSNSQLIINNLKKYS